MELNELISKLKDLTDKGKAAALDKIIDLLERAQPSSVIHEKSVAARLLAAALAAGEAVEKE